MTLTIQERRPDEMALALEIFNASNPPDMERTLEQEQSWQAMTRPEDHWSRVLAEMDGQAVAIGDAGHGPYDAAGRFGIQINVLPAYRRRGIGAALYQRLLDHVRREGADDVATFVHEHNLPLAEGWLAREGFREASRMRKSQVALADLDDATLSAAEERVRTGGITLGTLAEGDDDEVRRKLWQVYTLAERDVPWDRPRDGESFDRFQEMLNRPQCLHDCLVIAWDGTEIAGFTILGHARPGRATTWMTGVHPAYRNRGIALAVKARCARLARKREIEVLQTNNHVNNPAMLAVNARLGYQPLPETIVFVKRLA